MIPALQSLRFIFVMMIFMSHFTYQGVGAFDAGGDCGVAFFFLLSGFVLSLGYGSQLRDGSFCFSRFMRRRLLKVYPLHLLCMVAVLVASHQSFFQLRVLLNVLLLQCWVPLKDYYFGCNGVSWFLSCLLFCYVMFPWLYRHATRRLLVVAALLCGAAYLLVPYEWVNAVLYVHPLIRLFDFLLGIMLARVYERCRDNAPRAWEGPLLVALLALTLAVYPWTDAKLRNAPLYWVVLLPFILHFARSKGPLTRLLCLSPLRWAGSLSMPVFLLHPLLLSVLTRRLPDMPYGLMLAVCIVAVLLVSYVVDRFLLRQISQRR